MTADEPGAIVLAAMPSLSGKFTLIVVEYSAAI